MSNFVLDGRTMQDHFWGIGRYAYNLALALAQQAPQDNFRVLYNPNAKNTRFDLARLGAQPNIHLQPFPANAFSAREQTLAFDRMLLRDAALYHSPYYALPYALPLPTVVTLHDVTPLVVPEAMPGAAKRFVYRALHQLVARRAAHIITVSNAARADLMTHLRLPSSKLTVVPSAAFSLSAPPSLQTIERVRASLNLPPNYIVYLGINKPHKNLARLVEAFARVKTDAALVIAGHWDARYPQALDFVREHGMQERVLFRHDIAEPDVAPLLSGATAFVFPSLHEGFGLPPLEAMALGTPVVCANVSAIPEVVGDAALLFDPFDVAAIAEAVSRVLQDTDLRAALRKRGLAQAAKFSWGRTAQATLQVYRATLTQ